MNDIKKVCTTFSLLFLMTWQINSYATTDSTQLGLPNVMPLPLHPYLLDFGFKRIKTSDGGVLANTTKSCAPGYQLRYLVNLVDTEYNKGALEISNIYLETCLAKDKRIKVDKKANVNYFGPFTGTGKIKVSYSYICEPCKNCAPVAANC